MIIIIIFVCRHQDLHNEAFYMVTASSFWLAVRADLLCSVLITAVAFAFVLLSQEPGKEMPIWFKQMFVITTDYWNIMRFSYAPVSNFEISTSRNSSSPVSVEECWQTQVLGSMRVLDLVCNHVAYNKNYFKECTRKWSLVLRGERCFCSWHQHGCHDVTCKPAIIQVEPTRLSKEHPWQNNLTSNTQGAYNQSWIHYY